jgi:hypothetical protein
MSHKEKFVPPSIDIADAIESYSIHLGHETLSAPKKFLRQLGSPILSKVVEVRLSVEELDPSSNFVNIWIGNQLMHGVMADETHKTLKGYVDTPPTTEDKVYLEYPNGQKQEFHIPIIDA